MSEVLKKLAGIEQDLQEVMDQDGLGIIEARLARFSSNYLSQDGSFEGIPEGMDMRGFVGPFALV